MTKSILLTLTIWLAVFFTFFFVHNFYPIHPAYALAIGWIAGLITGKVTE